MKSHIFYIRNCFFFIFRWFIEQTCKFHDTKMDPYEHYSVQERTKIVELYFATKSPTLVQRQFQRKFPGKKILHHHTITRLIEKFRNTGSVVNNNKGHCSPKFLTHVQDVRTQLQQLPCKSIGRLSQQVGISSRSVRRIIHNDLKLFP